MVNKSTWGRRALFHAEPWARLLVDTLYHYRGAGYLLHEFVIMREHVHFLLTPAFEESLEKAVQYIKGGFSFRAKRELKFNGEIWQAGFNEHRITDVGDYKNHVTYIYENPVKARLAESPEQYRYSSASGLWEIDPAPEHLRG